MLWNNDLILELGGKICFIGENNGKLTLCILILQREWDLSSMVSWALQECISLLFPFFLSLEVVHWSQRSLLALLILLLHNSVLCSDSSKELLLLVAVLASVKLVMGFSRAVVFFCELFIIIAMFFVVAEFTIQYAFY